MVQAWRHHACDHLHVRKVKVRGFSEELHACSFQDILVQKGYNNGEPITREFFDEHISGGHNILLGKFLWPDWSQEDRDKFADEKEALFREYSGMQYPCLGDASMAMPLPSLVSEAVRGIKKP